jgi:hypothetical protein
MRDFEPWLWRHGGSVLRQALYYTRNDDKRIMILNQPGYVRAIVRAIVRNCFRDYIAVPSRTSDREVQFDTERHDGITSGESQDLRIAMLYLGDDEWELIIRHSTYCSSAGPNQVGRGSRNQYGLSLIPLKPVEEQLPKLHALVLISIQSKEPGPPDASSSL